MSLIGLASETVGTINALRSELTGNISTELAGFLQDANRFLLKHIQMINNTPLQVYCSGLAFSPTDSIIRRIFNNQRPSWMPVLPQVKKSWSAELQTLEGHFNWDSNVSSDNAHVKHGQGPHISVEHSWVCFGGEKVLWLPHEFRGRVCHAIKHDTLAMGYTNGRVLIIRLSTPFG
ncbi:unnamed protein product [Penicillium nalgiovense]|uniref:Uncharacterized protein n=1 Tax=Penicillium nalgiovense TaxID=60175 RepID=A0A9W4IN86_PENNA|nr:unnamed protein product [Penicillium nalgiovense]CAG7945964.1 unnamed protein product [Penicillium nalgiovense]CAG7950672.1 unnamed protein product [Penicillium nalgiovense]CAG7962539.1 unnamed protein product [Penicillium nalgiovense]CAG7978696.1 unnamed protein product [Penicillium nalgiovense]